MKKINVLFTVLMIFSAMFLLASCDEEVPPVVEHTHTWGEWEVLNEATCTAEGLKWRDCLTCSVFERETISKLEHSYGEGQVMAEATCTEAGFKIFVCSHCKDIVTEKIDAVGHEFENDVCIRCGHTEKEEQSYKLEVEVNGGTMSTVDGTYKEGTTISLPNPTKVGYIFDGWYTTEEFLPDSKINSVFVLEKDLNIYVKWLLDGYTVTLDANGGLVNNNTVVLKDYEVFKLEVPVSADNLFFGGWYLGSEQITDEFGECLKPWEVKEDVTLKATWEKEKVVNGVKYIYEGEYPQTVVTNTDLIEELNKIIETNERGYLSYNGQQYAKVVFKKQTSVAMFNNGEALVDGNTYYFLVEPILWRVLDIKNGLVISDSILDAMGYYNNEKTHESGVLINPNNYEYSDINGWLNGGLKFTNNNFATKAFADPIKTLKMTEDIDNSASSTDNASNPYICRDFTTYLYLLSYQEYYVTYYNLLDKGVAKVTDYAIAQNVRVDNYTMKGEWWLRTPASTSASMALVVGVTGKTHSKPVNTDGVGIRPAVVLKELYIEGGLVNE